MKKRSALLVAAFAFLAFAIPAQAQTTLYLGAGGSFPTGDFGEYANTGWMGAVGALFGVGPVGVGAEFFYGQNGHKDEASFFEDDKTTPYGVMAIVDYTFVQSGAIRPYVFGGLGIMWHRYSAGEFSESDSAFGYQAGAGVAFPIGATSSLFAEGRYLGSGEMGEGDLAETTNYFGLLAGFAFTVGN